MRKRQAGGCFAALLAAHAGPANGATPDWAFRDPLLADVFMAVMAVLALITFISATIVTQRAKRQLANSAERLADTEARLNDAETLLSAEPHLLFIWTGREAGPDRISGDMRGVCNVPEDHARLGNFPLWLELESATRLIKRLDGLRSSGEPFNFGVRTRSGESLEADGRTAGGMATLRLRPLIGEREDNNRLVLEAEKLRLQVSQLSIILDSAPMPVWLRNSDRRLVWANRAYVEAVEAGSIARIVRENIEIVAPREIPAELPEGRRSTRVRTTIGGKKRMLDLLEVRIENGAAGFAVDVSELENAKTELERHIDAHSRVLDGLKTAVAIFGPDHRLRFFNAIYAELWQLEPAWLATRPSMSEILDRLRADRRLPEQANYRDWKARQLAVLLQTETVEDRWHLPDGQTIRVTGERHPLGGTAFIFENMTEQLKLKSSYNELTSVQRETLDNLKEGLALFGSDGRLKLFNPSFAQFWNIDSAALRSEPHVDEVIAWCRKLLPVDAAWENLKIAITSLQSERATFRDRVSRPDGGVFDSAIVPLPDGNTLFTCVDVTDSSRIENALRERAEALEKADRLKTDFLSNVSYELRTPLTNISGFADAMNMGIAGDLSPRQAEYLQNIQSSSAQLSSIIDSILDLASVDAGAMELSPTQMDVAELLTDAADLVKDLVKNRGLTLEVRIPDGAETMIGDKRRLGQVLSNLLSNAIGFSSRGATVRLGCDLQRDRVRIWVSDTGRGMDEETRKAAFDRFAAKPARSGHRGAGLGLAIVKSFVELHEGSVDLKSVVGEGTTIAFELPRAGPSDRKRRPIEESDDDAPVESPLRNVG